MANTEPSFPQHDIASRVPTTSPLVWDAATTLKFWNHYSRSPDLYFTNRYGARLLDCVRKDISTSGRVVDYACGTGGLTGLLLDAGLQVKATDISPVAVDGVSQRYADRKNFFGAQLVGELLESREQFSAVFLIEMIEHLDNAVLPDVFCDVRQLMTQNGLVVISTPNGEDLDAETVYCPCCNHTFHRWQHVRTWSANSLTDFLLKQGFEPVKIITTDLSLSPRDGRLRYILKQLASRLLHRKLPHLVVVARQIAR